MGGVTAALVAVALLLRMLFGFAYWVDKPLTHDEREYLSLAASLAQGRGFVYATAVEGTSDRFSRAPFYPLFLAALFTVAGQPAPEIASTPASVKIAQSILGALLVWLIGAIAARSAGLSAGRVAMAIAATYPPLIGICAYVLSETLYGVLALTSALLLDVALGGSFRAADTSDPRVERRYALASGLFAGAAALTRPVMLFYLMLAGALLVVRRRFGVVVALAIGAGILIGPWTIRNAREYGRFVLIASEGGVTFWTGNHPLSRGEGDLAANPQLKRANLELRAQSPGFTAEQLESVYYGDAFTYIREDPVWWAGLLVRKFFYTWVPIGPSYILHSRRYFVTSVVSYTVVALLAAAGLWHRRRSASQPYVLGVLALSAVLTCVVFFPQERFRLPVIDPSLIVCAGGLFDRREWSA